MSPTTLPMDKTGPESAAVQTTIESPQLNRGKSRHDHGPMATIAGFWRTARTTFLSPYSVGARLARNSLWALTGSAFSQGSSLLAALLLGRMLGLTGFGQLALIQTTVLLLGSLGEAGLALTTTKLTGRWRISDPARAGRLMGWSLRVTAISGLLMALLLAVVEPYVGRFGSGSLSIEFLAAGGLLIFDMLNRLQFGALAGLEAFEGTARIHLWRGLLTLPLLWLGTRYWGLAGAVLAMAAVSFATFVIGHRVLRRQCSLRSITLGYGASRERGVLTTSVSIWTSALLLTGSTWLVTVLLARQPTGLAELGLFNAADRWKTALLFLPTVLFQVVLPMLSHSHAAGDHRACGRITSASLALTTAVTGTAALLIFAISPVLMSWYGHGFEAGTGVLSLAALGAVVSAIYTVGSGVLWALGKPAQMLRIDLFKTALLVGLCLMGLASSAWNVALAYLLSLSAGSVILMFFVFRQLRTQ